MQVSLTRQFQLAFIQASGMKWATSAVTNPTDCATWQATWTGAATHPSLPAGEERGHPRAEMTQERPKGWISQVLRRCRLLPGDDRDMMWKGLKAWNSC